MLKMAKVKVTVKTQYRVKERERGRETQGKEGRESRDTISQHSWFSQLRCEVTPLDSSVLISVKSSHLFFIWVMHSNVFTGFRFYIVAMSDMRSQPIAQQAIDEALLSKLKKVKSQRS